VDIEYIRNRLVPILLAEWCVLLALSNTTLFVRSMSVFLPIQLPMTSENIGERVKSILPNFFCKLNKEWPRHA